MLRQGLGDLDSARFHGLVNAGDGAALHEERGAGAGAEGAPTALLR